MTEATITLATVENMRKAESIAPGLRVIAFSPLTGEEYSATPGDYWNHPADEPLRDSEGEPMILVNRRVSYVDVLTGETL
jgi:hypothetical protein